jgi:hypothetical protein
MKFDSDTACVVVHAVSFKKNTKNIAFWEKKNNTCVRIQLQIGLKQKFSFTHFHENFRESTKILAKVSLRKFTNMAEALMIWTSLGSG